MERKLSAHDAAFYLVARAAGQPRQHGDVQFICLLKGSLALRIKADGRVLESGDSMHFDSGVPYGYRSLPKGRCAALVVTIP
ncbi:MAG: cupin domain-containing protein [Acidobacteria bacterium]|nr:cupin domain-containing protein [Acidobacteriota bacterium]